MAVMVGQNMLPSNSAYASSFGSGIANALNGNLEFNRTQQLQQQQQIFNAEEAEKNRKWQEYMSNTAYQRQKADLQKAGYNPALLLNASGASVGSGATASSGSYSAPGTTAGMYSLMNTTLHSAFQLVRDSINRPYQLVDKLLK